MTTQLQPTVQREPDLLASVERLDAEIKALLAELRATNDRMRQENERLRQRLGLPGRNEVQQ